MGGTKKRKRDDYYIEGDKDEIGDSNLQTPIPNTPNLKKRKSSEFYNEENSKKSRLDKNNVSNKISRKRNRKFKKKNQRAVDDQKGNDGSDIQRQNPVIENQRNDNPNEKKNRKRKRNRPKKSKQMETNKDTGNTCDTFQPYDYSSVDFRKFQGGAVQSGGHKPFKSKFKPKVSRDDIFWFVLLYIFLQGKRRGGNKGNKSANFGTVRKGTEYGL